MDGGNQFASFVRGRPARDSAAWLLRRATEARQDAEPRPVFARDLSEAALAKPAAATYGDAEIEAARQQGHEAGYQAGLAAAAASREAAEQAALTAIATTLEAGTAAAAIVADDAAAALARSLLLSLQAAFPALTRRSALDEAGALLAHVLPGLSREPEIETRVPPAIADGVATLVTRLGPSYAGRVTVLADAQLAPGDVQVRWAAGAALREPGAVWQAIADALDPFLSQDDVKEAANVG